MKRNKDKKAKKKFKHKSLGSSLILISIFFFIILITLFFNFQIAINRHKSLDNEETSLNTSSLSLNGFLHDETIINCSDSTGLIYVTDANGDGCNDVFVGEWYNNFFTVLYWNPDIRYWDPIVRKNTTFYTGRIIVEDVNNDGKKDVITKTYLGFIEIRLWNDSIGDWNNAIIKEPCSYTYGICIGDANNDGINEIIVLDQYGSSFIYIYYWNQTKGDFTKLTKSIDHVGCEVKVADVNNDGLNEIITFTYNPKRLVVFYWNQTSSDWTIDTKTVTNLGYIDYFSIGDVNNDGYKDIIFETYSHDYYNMIILLWNQTLSDWNDEIVIQISSRIRDIEIGDINDDNQNDIVIDTTHHFSIFCWNKSIVYWNPPINGSVTGGVRSTHGCIYIGDINNDGINDLLLKNSKIQGFSLFLGYYPIEIPVLESITPNINYYNNVVLRWNSIENATVYYIYREIEEIISTSHNTPIAIVSEVNYTDYVPINGKYTYAITAGDRLAQSPISNNINVIVSVNLTSKLLYQGNTVFEIDSNCTDDDIKISFSMSLTNDTTIFYSCYKQVPNNLSLDNSFLFIEVLFNNTFNIEGDINFSIYFNTIQYKNLTLWLLDVNFKDGTGVWEKIELSQEDTGLIIISTENFYIFAFSNVVIQEGAHFIIINYILFSLLNIFCFLLASIFKKYRNTIIH